MDKYSSYKDSGIYFIPEIPASWGVLKAKYLFNEEKRVVRPEDEIVTCFRDGQVTLRKNRRVEGFTNSMKEIGYQGVRKGDLVIHNMDAFAGAIGVSDSDGKATPVYACCTPKREDINQYYYCYLLRFLARNGFILSLAKGIRERSTDFRFNDFKELYLPVPSRREQDAIVSYLDTVTTQIDTAIEQQKKMIELLNERKQIIINNAVTKGLDPNVKMKDSGVDWIGEIPEHWDFCKFNHIISVLTDYTANGSFGDLAKNVHYQSEGYARLVRLTDLRDNLQNENGVWVDKHGYEYLSKSSLYGGELLIANVGAYSGLVQIMPKVDYLTTLAPNMFLLKLDNTKVLTDYIYFLLLSKAYFNWLQTIAIASAQPKLNKDNIRTLPILIPTIDEQKAIVDRIANAIKPLENLISITQKQISLLQERKQIIINEVVTGKVKVV